MNYISEKVGKVSLLIPSTLPKDNYTDKAEDTLLELFTGSDIDSRRQEILDNNPSWALFYHLSPWRGNLLCWYDFSAEAEVLEIGAGCGAITEVLVKKKVRLTALELTQKRATINAYRNQNSPNLEVVVGSLEDYKPEKKFDYVICVGVLEYAGTFIHTENPYDTFLKKIYQLLSPGGKLLVAIENRFGLKYWAGASEDHTHKFFEGQNGYPSDSGVRTFGRKELKTLLSNNKFTRPYFYYPFPDYKNPMFVYSDDFHPGYGTNFPLSSLPTKTPDWPRLNLLSEQSLMRFIEGNGLFPEFSNSFLVEGQK